MQAKVYKTSSTSKGQKTAVPHPNIITQVSKDEAKKFQLSDLFNLQKCCNYIWKCLPVKKQEFNQITDTTAALLDPQASKFKGKKTLVLDLDETLVHSTFEPVENPDLILPVKIQGNTYKINVIIRPGCEEFLEKVGELFEVVVFTASLAEYAEPLCEILDKKRVISGMLYRQHCTPLNGIYVKDLSLIGRDMKDIILIDNSPNSFLFQPENAYHIKNFFEDKTDCELVKLYHFLEDIADIKDVRPIEDLRRQLEQQPKQSQILKFFKAFANSESKHQPSSSISSNQPLRQAEERDRVFNVETEPDLRRDEKGDFVAACDADGNRFGFYGARAVPLTERIPERPFWYSPADSSVDIVDMALPSPKESDNLINHRKADMYLENNSETDSEKNNGTHVKPEIVHKIVEANLPQYAHREKEAEIVTVKDENIDGHHVEDVRYLTGIDNLNSPLGKHIKIEFPIQ